MNTEMIQGYVGDEDCFSVGNHHIPNQYFKCPETGLEMIFTFRLGSGWTVQGIPGQSVLQILRYNRVGRKIPFPKTPKKYEKQERDFYDNLKKLRELDL